MILLLFFLFVSRVTAMIAARDKNTIESISKKTCPPHQWYYDDLKDVDGNFVKWRMVCKVCGPLQPLDANRGKMDQ